MIKPEFLGIFNKDIANIAKNNAELAFDSKLANNKNFQDLLKSYIDTKQFDPATINALQKMGGVDPSVTPRTRAQQAEVNRKMAQAFTTLTVQLRFSLLIQQRT